MGAVHVRPSQSSVVQETGAQLRPLSTRFVCVRCTWKHALRRPKVQRPVNVSNRNALPRMKI